MTRGMEPKTREQWHTYWVLNDPEFRREAYAVSDYARMKHWKAKGIVKPTDKERAVDEQLKNQLLEKFKVSEAVLASSLTGSIAPGVFDEAIVSTSVDELTDTVQVRYKVTVTRDEYIRGWDEVQNHLKFHGYQKGTSKRKPPQETKLLYAIFKARQRGETFKQIFWQYQQETLPGYSGSSNQFTSEDSLERYYQKYQPGK